LGRYRLWLCPRPTPIRRADELGPGGGRARAHVIQHLITYLVWAVYVGVGVGVAGANGYLGHLSHAVPIVWAAGAVLAWPLVFIE